MIVVIHPEWSNVLHTSKPGTKSLMACIPTISHIMPKNNGPWPLLKLVVYLWKFKTMHEARCSSRLLYLMVNYSSFFNIIIDIDSCCTLRSITFLALLRQPCHEPSCHHTIDFSGFSTGKNKASLNSATYISCYNSKLLSIMAVFIEIPCLHCELYTLPPFWKFKCASCEVLYMNKFCKHLMVWSIS